MASRAIRSLLAMLLGGAALLVPSLARADFAPREPWEDEPPKRRGGFMVGLTLGFGISNIAGFPNDPEKVGFASYYTVSGVRPGVFGGGWIGGALADWLNFGVGGTGNTMLGLDHGESSVVGAFVFHVEMFPLYPLGGRMRDLGFWIDAGTGPVDLKPKTGDTFLVEGGAPSLFGVGIFYEGLRAWRLGNGPFVAMNYMFSESVRRPAVFLGWRTALYTGVFDKRTAP